MIGRNKAAKISIVSNDIYIFNVIAIKIPMYFHRKYKKGILKFMWSQKSLEVSKTILRKKNEAGGITLYDFPNYNGKQEY